MSDDILRIDTSKLQEFIDSFCDDVKVNLAKEVETWFDALGIDFLRIVQDEIIRKEVVDSRLLLNSFHKGAEGNIWNANVNGVEVSLEIGTSLQYAGYVNDGYEQKRRFVPGEWQGDKFIYDPNSKTGMMLTAKFIEGAHYFESAFEIFEKIFEKSLEQKMEEWLSRYGG